MAHDISSIYIPLRLRGYETERKLNTYVLAIRLVLFFVSF